MQNQISRTELYHLVWSEPLSKLAGRFGLSDNGLRLRCTRHNIPLPPTGFRQRQAAGYKPEKRPLPDPGNDEMIVFKTVVETEVAKRLMDEVFGPLLAHETHPSSDVDVRDDDIQHAIARETFAGLTSATPDPFGGLCHDALSFRVRVYPGSVERACRIVGAIFRAAEQRGFLSDDGMNRLVIGGSRPDFSIEERASRRPGSSGSNSFMPRFPGQINEDWQPSSLLRMQVPGGPSPMTQKSVSDRPKRLIETQIGRLLTLLIEEAHARAVLSARRDAADGLRETENARRGALREARQDEVQFLERLEREAALWARAEAIRAFAAALGKTGVDDDRANAVRALQHADRLDPLTPSPQSPLDWSEKDVEPLPGWWNFERDG